jgi:hypothetical protein
MTSHRNKLNSILTYSLLINVTAYWSLLYDSYGCVFICLTVKYVISVNLLEHLKRNGEYLTLSGLEYKRKTSIGMKREK